MCFKKFNESDKNAFLPKLNFHEINLLKVLKGVLFNRY